LKVKGIQGKGNIGKELQFELFQLYEEIQSNFESVDDNEDGSDENAKDNQLRLILQEVKNIKMELSNHGLKALVKDEVPKQMLALTFEQQLGKILAGSSSSDEDDDYDGWLRRVNLDGFYKKVNKC
jgi:hypothetical protein